MDQVKEFLRQCVKYRFWISLVTAALFSVIAYVLGSGPVKLKAETETRAITQANNDVKPFSLPGVPNDQYKPLVDKKTTVLAGDVNAAWKQLYNRQAPLLTWPEIVDKRFREWGRKWPEKVADNAVSLAIVDYIEAYPKYVDEVYTIFHPFDYETGKGIVSAPPKESLLRPVTFDINKLPELGKLWSAQERLWVQRTAFEVISQVNKNAKDWDSAIIKQINFLEVGNATAQDQRSVAKGETLTEPEAIVAPGTPEPEADTAAASGSPMAGMMAAMSGMMGMAGASANPETISYIKPEKGSFKIMPILLSVLIDQEHLQDLLIELENSPMSIQVMEFQLERPSSRVTKPEKGAMGNMAGMGMMGGYGETMMRGMMGSKGGMMGYGGMMSGYSNMMRGMMGGRGEMMGRGMGMGMGMGMGTGPTRKGTDKRSTDRGKTRDEAIKAVETSKGLSLFDPYYDIVEVKVYGQARFYDAPPADEPSEPSPGEAAADAPASTEPEKNAAAAKAEPTKAAETPDEPAKNSEPAKTEPAKADAAKIQPAKADAAKIEPAKADAAKTEPAKSGESKEAAPKS